MIEAKDELEKELKAEIEEFKREKERVREMVGRIGGTKKNKIENTINMFFLITVIIFFLLEMIFHVVPSYISLEIGILLVSIKIVWMIHSQHKVNHFQFWILTAIEFRMSDINKRIKKMEKKLEEIDKFD